MDVRATFAGSGGAVCTEANRRRYHVHPGSYHVATRAHPGPPQFTLTHLAPTL